MRASPALQLPVSPNTSKWVGGGKTPPPQTKPFANIYCRKFFVKCYNRQKIHWSADHFIKYSHQKLLHCASITPNRILRKFEALCTKRLSRHLNTGQKRTGSAKLIVCFRIYSRTTGCESNSWTWPLSQWQCGGSVSKQKEFSTRKIFKNLIKKLISHVLCVYIRY